jgi:hypothetical protein
LDVETCGILIKVSGILLGFFSFVLCLLFGFILFFFSLLEALPYIGDFIRYVILLPMGIGLIASIVGIVLGFMYFKLGGKVESGLLTKKERNTWLVVTLLLFILFLLSKLWVFLILIAPALLGLIFLKGFAEETLRGRRPFSYR